MSLVLQKILFFLTNNPRISFLIKFALFYYVLYYLFIGYEALDSPNGQYYSTWIHEHSLIQFIKDILKYSVGVVMNLLGYPNKYSLHGIVLDNGFVIRIEFSCLGIKVMIIYTALLLAYGAFDLTKLYFWLGGLLMIHVLNTLRMVSIFLLWMRYDRKAGHLVHDNFNYFAYACILVLFYLYIKHNSVVKKHI